MARPAPRLAPVTMVTAPRRSDGSQVPPDMAAIIAKQAFAAPMRSIQCSRVSRGGIHYQTSTVRVGDDRRWWRSCSNEGSPAVPDPGRAAAVDGADLDAPGRRRPGRWLHDRPEDVARDRHRG